MEFRELFNVFCEIGTDIWSEKNYQFSMSYNVSTVILEALTFRFLYWQPIPSQIVKDRIRNSPWAFQGYPQNKESY